MTTSLERPESLRLPPAERSWRQTLWAILGVLMFAGMLVAAGLYTAPTLVSDWQIRNAAQPIDAEVTDGQCSSKIIFNICNATLAVQTPEGLVSRRVNYVFTGVHIGDYGVGPMADPARPDLVTTDMALDRLWNRTITLIVGAGTLLALTVLPIVAMIRNRRRLDRAA